jgi:SAM-dependent methyltransferase
MNALDSMPYIAPYVSTRASEYAPKEPHDYLWNQLAELPYFRALLRAVESRFYGQLPVVAPVLDLGAGDGSFSAQTFSRPLDAGIDPWWSPTVEAKSLHAHRVLALAQGATLPFANNTFQTVVSNSVLEHIPDLDPVICEAYRVLRPGGYLLFCAPSDHFTDWLVGARVLGDSYREWFNRISRHAHCDSPDQWRARLAQAGFITEQIWYYFSPKALRTLEIGHYLGLPNLLSKKLFGKWVILPSRSNPFLRLTNAWLKPLYNEPLPTVGAYLFGVARKP